MYIMNYIKEDGMAPLQKRACFGLVFGVIWAVALIVVFIVKGGVEAFNSDSSFRLIVDALWIAGLIVYLILFMSIVRSPQQVDERDRLIMDRAPRVQNIAIIFALVAWTIALNEVYHGTGHIPSVYLYIIFMSVLIVSQLAQSLGILIGYWRMEHNA